MRKLLRILNFVVFSPFVIIMFMFGLWQVNDDKLKVVKK